MKTKKLITIILPALFFSHAIFAQDACSVIGYHPPGSQTYNGPTWCNNVSIENIIVHGPLQIQQSTLSGETKVDGPMTVSQTTFSGETNIGGPITATQSHFNAINERNSFSNQTISLADNSVVNGNIVFTGVMGTVILDKSSTVTGKVVNGTIVHQ